MKNILDALVYELPLGLVVLDQHRAIRYMNEHMVRWTTLKTEDAAGRDFLSVFPEVDGSVLADMLSSQDDGGPLPDREKKPGTIELHLSEKFLETGRIESLFCFPFLDDAGDVCHALLFHDPAGMLALHRGLVVAIRKLEDVGLQRHHLVRKLDRINNQLLQSEKLAGIGQLAAGVAHEINNPVGYVFSNLKTLASYMQDLLKITDAVDQAASLEEVQQLKQTLEYGYIRDDVEALINESEEGIGRVKKIITALKDFSHIEEEGFRKADLHRGIETTLNVANNEIKYKAAIVKQYGLLPEVECNASQINQVVMNLLMNAAQSISSFGTITIRSGHEGPSVWLEVEDTGHGMDPPTMKRIFDPFFTTKPMGRGTGLGLSLSYSIIQKHHGHIEVFSEPGQGSRFKVWLPVKHIGLSDL